MKSTQQNQTQKNAQSLLKNLTVAQAIKVAQNLTATKCPNAFSNWHSVIIYLKAIKQH